MRTRSPLVTTAGPVIILLHQVMQTESRRTLFTRWLHNICISLIWGKHGFMNSLKKCLLQYDYFNPASGKNGGINGGTFTFKEAWELPKNKYLEERNRLESCRDYYLHTKLLIKALYWQHNYLVPNWVQVLIYDFAFVQRLPIQLKFYIRVTRAFKGKREHDRILNTHLQI